MLGLVFTPPKLYSNEQILASQQPLMTVVGAWNKIGKLASVQYCENDVYFDKAGAGVGTGFIRPILLGDSVVSFSFCS